MNRADAEMHPKKPEKEARGGKLKLRVMTYNIHSCVDQNRTVRYDKFAGIIEERQADIIALQEVDAQKPFDENRNQAEMLADKLKMDHIFFPAEDAGLRAFGLAILSRFPFMASHGGLLPQLYPRLKPRKRAAVQASIHTPAGPLHIFNAHLSLFKLERRRQLKALLGRGWLAAVPAGEPVIFCGDLNAGPLSKTYRTLSRHLVDVQKAIKGPGGSAAQPTFHSRSPLFRIDHIFVSRHFRCVNVEVTKNPATQAASDHLPLTADLAV
jgi:endonuclease/exonuclease/phosphatase family metal-dependent hydrolase